MSCSAKEIPSTITSGPSIHGAVELTVVMPCVNEAEALAVELKSYRRRVRGPDGDSRSNAHRTGFQNSPRELLP
jgi:hypothetical protein